jgi:hypothetical protein
VTLRLYLNHHVPVAVRDGLRRRGVDVVTAEEDQSARLDDDVLLARARDLGRVLVTQDDDFLVIAADWQQANRPFAGVAYGHQLRVTIGQAVRDLALLAEALEPGDMMSRVVYLPL